LTYYIAWKAWDRRTTKNVFGADKGNFFLFPCCFGLAFLSKLFGINRRGLLRVNENSPLQDFHWINSQLCPEAFPFNDFNALFK